MKTRIGNKNDINRILSLQERNLDGSLDERERESGFVTTPFTINQILEIIKQNGVFIAENKNKKIISYAFVGSWKYFEQWEIFNFMVSRFSRLSFNTKNITTKNSFQYGPYMYQ